MATVRTAAVIGGGIAGPVVASALRKAGVEATVYESHPTRSDGAGGTLALAPNGLAALEIVGAAEAVEAAAQPISRQAMAVGDSKHFALPGLPDVGPLRIVHRSDLYRALHDRAAAHGVRTEYGKRLVDARESGDAVTALFEDGTSATADVLIGADGVHSAVRRLIDPAAPGPRFTGMLGFEGLADFEPPVDRETMTFAFGKRAYYLYWREATGGTRWGANLPHRPLSLTEARRTPNEEWMATLRTTYGEDTPGGELVRRTDPAGLQVVGALHMMPPVPHWHRGRMVLVGDAVHAPSNSSGQGASLAIESAIQLARCLRDFDRVREAYAAYERLRRPRVERIAAMAAKTNRAKAPGPVAQKIMPLLMPLFIKAAMNPEKTIGPAQRYRIDWDAPATADRARA
ncbi:FAD-dependent monooxygenase [Glycomyces arizonensis]|uniref:FAD-dependent monooxygenase n=1 Tax=Glycomyces arizonensis TaxID=256035 RepID=UPI0003FF587A|nr:FAD-dependent monooxygenase [Glycomyces arizonensis]